MVKGYDKFGKNGGQMNARHYAHNDYYEKGHTIPGIAFGNLSAELGVDQGAPIDDKAFRALSANKHADTEKQLTRHVEDRKPFCDMTCSAPKTFSVAAIVGDAERVFRYHRQATQKVIGELHRIVGRQANNGKEHLERTGNVAGVAYEHDSNRCQEAQLHTHLVIWNVTKSANGKLYAIEYRAFMDQSPYLTAVYRDELARAALADGLNITIGEHGQPEISELMGMAKEHQQRSEELDVLVERIEEHAGTKLTDREVGIIVRASRGLDVNKFERLWDASKSELDQLKNLDPDTAENDRRELLKRFSEIVRECSQSDLRKISTQEVRAEQQARVTPEQREILEHVRNSSDRREEFLIHDLDKSIAYAIEHCFENESVIKDYELYETILQHAQGAGVDLAEMRVKVASHPGLVFGTHSEIGSADHYKRELASGILIKEGKGKGEAILPQGPSDHLSKQQRQAVKSLLESRDQFTALSGSSGVGKTEYVLAEVIKANVVAGHRVAVVAPSDAARDVIHHDARKLAPGSARDALSGAVSLQLYQANPRLHQELGPGDLLIIDEASFVSLKQGHAELERAAKRGVRVLMVGDLDQGKSIDAGDFFRMVMRFGIHTAELHDIRRQSSTALDGHYLKAIKLFKKGRTTQAFKELLAAGCIHEVRGKERVEVIADAILRSKAAGVSTMCANFTHRENDAISVALRAKMKALGQLRDERTLTVYGTLGWSDAQKKDVSKLRPGYVLEITRGKDKGAAWTVVDQQEGNAYAKNVAGEIRTFTKTHYKLFDVCQQRELPIAIGDELFARSANRKGELINGSRLEVAGWDELGNPVDAKGHSVDHRNLCHAYASTARKVQGSAATRIITGFDRKSVKSATRDVPYVINGRGREFCEIYVESIADLSQIQNRSGDRKTVTEMRIETVPQSLHELVRKFEQRPPVDLQAEKLIAKQARPPAVVQEIQLAKSASKRVNAWHYQTPEHNQQPEIER